LLVDGWFCRQHWLRVSCHVAPLLHCSSIVRWTTVLRCWCGFVAMRWTRSNVVTLRRARLVPGWVTVLRWVNHLGTEPGAPVDSAWAIPPWVGKNEYSVLAVALTTAREERRVLHNSRPLWPGLLAYWPGWDCGALVTVAFTAPCINISTTTTTTIVG